jgi:hypothetical protein
MLNFTKMYTDLITIGDAVLDNYVIVDDATVHCDIKHEPCELCFKYSAKIPIKGSAQSVGGNAANVAVGCHLLGFNTTLVTEVGDDLNGHAIVTSLKKTGIGTKYIQVKKQETRYAIVLNYKGERTILSYHADRNYTLPKLPKSRWIYYTSLSQSFEKLQTKLLKHLKQNPNVKLAVNPGSYQLSHGINEIKKILPLTEVLILNKDEAEKIVGKKKTKKGLLKALLKTKVKIAVVTDGPKGAFATDGEKFLFMPIYPLKSKAKTGAGDAFTSGVLSALMMEKSLEYALMWGTANSAGVIQKVGAQEGLLKRHNVLSMVRKYSKIKPKHL